MDVRTAASPLCRQTLRVGVVVLDGQWTVSTRSSWFSSAWRSMHPLTLHMGPAVLLAVLVFVMAAAFASSSLAMKTLQGARPALDRRVARA